MFKFTLHNSNYGFFQTETMGRCSDIEISFDERRGGMNKQLVCLDKRKPM